MSNLVIILGSSGAGKSTSIKTLNPQETVVLNVLGKDLPFKGSRANYTREKKNLIQSSKWDSIAAMIPSVFAMYSKASTASSSVTGTYFALPIS